jgi:hypothetical protein
MTAEERKAWIAKRDPAKVRAADRARYRRDREKRLAAQRAYQATERGRAARDRSQARQRAQNPAKYKAVTAVGNALRDGKLVRGPCESAGHDCAGAIHAHHDDYSKPLEVRWLCRRHHELHHRQS